jgi:hypothetical protein
LSAQKQRIYQERDRAKTVRTVAAIMREHDEETINRGCEEASQATTSMMQASQLITTGQGVELANSLISGTPTEEQLITWKKKNCATFRVNGNVRLGKDYWQVFMKQNKHLIHAKMMSLCGGI